MEVGRDGAFLRISEDESPDLAAQVLNSIAQYLTLMPEGLFREDDDLSAIMKTVESIDERRNANHRPSQLIDPFGYHLVGFKIVANAIRLHDEVVSLCLWSGYELCM